MSNILLIGGGNMASAIISGLITDGYDPNHIFVAEHHKEKCQKLEKAYQIHAYHSLDEIQHDIDIIVFAIKPQHFKAAALDAQSFLKKQPLVISIAAGIPIALIETLLGKETAIVRTMPNTPALVNCGASGLFANTHVTDEQKNHAERLMRAIGLTVWLENEDQIDVVTALSGSGPAYFFALIEHMQSAAEALNLPPNIAAQLAKQTALGAARLAMESDLPVSELRQQVTSPEGTTAAALDTFNHHDFSGIVRHAMTAAHARAKELAKAKT